MVVPEMLFPMATEEVEKCGLPRNSTDLYIKNSKGSTDGL